MDRQMNGKRRAARRKRRQTLAVRHCRSSSRHARQNDALRDAGHRQLAAQNGGGGGKSRYARRERVGNSMTPQAPKLLAPPPLIQQVPPINPSPTEPPTIGIAVLP